MAGHTNVASLWLTDKGKPVIPGAIVGVAFVTATPETDSTIASDFSMSKDSSRMRALTFTNNNNEATQLILPVIIVNGKWKVSTPILDMLTTKWHLNTDTMKCIRMGVVTYVAREPTKEEIVDSLFNPDQCHHLPRIKMCLGA